MMMIARKEAKDGSMSNEISPILSRRHYKSNEKRSAWKDTTWKLNGTSYCTSNMPGIRAVKSGIDTLAKIDVIEDWTQSVHPSDFIPREQWHDEPVVSAAGLADSTKL